MTGNNDPASLVGFCFVSETLEPPKTALYGQVRQNSVCSYKFIFGSKEPIYFSEFSASGIRLSRADICRAWTYGLKTSLFLDCVGYAARKESVKDPNTYIEALRALVARREWNGCFIELNYALNLLSECERAHVVPSRWRPEQPYNLHDLRLCRSRSTAGTRPGHLTPLFLIAANHLLELERSGGRLEEFQELAQRLPTYRHVEPFDPPRCQFDRAKILCSDQTSANCAEKSSLRLCVSGQQHMNLSDYRALPADSSEDGDDIGNIGLISGQESSTPLVRKVSHIVNKLFRHR